MKTFEQYNESIKDKMTPISSESITKKLGNLSDSELTNYITDLIFKNDNDVLTVVIKSTDMSRIDDYQLYDLIELSIDMKNLTAVNLLLDKDLPIEILHRLYLQANTRGYIDIARFIERVITTVESTGSSINESIRDKMTPRSGDDIRDKVKNLSIDDALMKCYMHNIKPGDYLDIDKLKDWIKTVPTLKLRSTWDIDPESNLGIVCFDEILRRTEKGDVIARAYMNGIIGKKRYWYTVFYKGNKRLSESVNEGVRDKMTPRYAEDIKKQLSGMSIGKALDVCKKNGIRISDYIPIDRVKMMLDSVPTDKILAFCITNGIELSDHYSVDEIEVLIKHCKNPGEVLFLATENNRVVDVSMLIESGVDLNVSNNAGWNALMLATKNGHKEIVDMLLKNGASVNPKNNRSFTALMIACEDNNTDIVKMLVDNGANVNIGNGEDYHTPLKFACQNGNRDIVKILIENGVSVNPRKAKDDRTALMMASDRGYTEIVEMLLKNGADPNVCGRNCGTALMGAVRIGAMGVVRLLVKYGADVNIGDDNKETALVHALRDLHSRHNAFRLQNGGKSITWDKDRQIEIIEFLIQNGADVNLANKAGYTPLIVASYYNCFEFVKVLIANGADVNLMNNDGETALMTARKSGYTKIVNLLKTHGAKE